MRCCKLVFASERQCRPSAALTHRYRSKHSVSILTLTRNSVNTRPILLGQRPITFHSVSVERVCNVPQRQSNHYPRYWGYQIDSIDMLAFLPMVITHQTSHKNRPKHLHHGISDSIPCYHSEFTENINIKNIVSSPKFHGESDSRLISYVFLAAWMLNWHTHCSAKSSKSGYQTKTVLIQWERLYYHHLAIKTRSTYYHGSVMRLSRLITYNKYVNMTLQTSIRFCCFRPIWLDTGSSQEIQLNQGKAPIIDGTWYIEPSGVRFDHWGTHAWWYNNV